MDTYAIRALTAIDSAAVARIRANHDTYRDLVTSGETVPYPHWAGMFEVNVDELLEIIERITRPAATATICRTCGFTDCPGANGGNCPRWPSRDELAKVTTGTGWPSAS